MNKRCARLLGIITLTTAVLALCGCSKKEPADPNKAATATETAAKDKKAEADAAGQEPTVTRGPSGDVKGGLEEAFDALDTNKDGKISKAEYAAIWKEGVRVDEKFKFFDADGNGFIEREEYLGLPARMKHRSGGQSKSATSGPTPLEATKVRQAIDAMPNWARIRELVSAKKMNEVTQIAKDAGFESWPALERYFIVLNTVQESLETNREAAADRLSRLYGQETIDIVSEPENMEKIKAHRPK